MKNTRSLLETHCPDSVRKSVLRFFDASDGAVFSACSASDAAGFIDFIRLSDLNARNRAIACACSASDALISDSVCHFSPLLKIKLLRVRLMSSALRILYFFYEIKQFCFFYMP